MRIEKLFTVRAAPDAVWALLTNPKRVAACLPGAAITGQTGERAYAGTITVKVGPVGTSYRGTVSFERLDHATRTAEIVALGQDVRGKGGASLRMTSQLAERAAGETEVAVVSEVDVTGILAQMGRGMIQDVGDQLFERFTDAVRGQLEAAPAAAPAGGAAAGPAPAGAPPPAAPTPAAPIQVVSLGAGVAARALGRLARRPLVWATAIVVAVLLWLWLR